MDVKVAGLPSFEYWSGKRVAVTGHTGFKGSWLCEMLLSLGAEVNGFALPPLTEQNIFEMLDLSSRIDHEIGDVRDLNVLKKWITRAEPDVILHLAAQPIVSESYLLPVETFATNVMGTVNLLEACRYHNFSGPVVIVTSDKCYKNNDGQRDFRVGDPLGGKDPYSASKAAAEIVTASYQTSFVKEVACFSKIATARAGNVIGGGDFTKDRLIPDAIKAWSSGKELVLRNPTFTRPWQHVVEPVAGYLLLAERLSGSQKFSRPWNFGPDHRSDTSVRSCINSLAQLWPGSALVIENEPGGQGWTEAKTLSLNIDETIEKLGWRPRFGMHETLSLTVEWYTEALKDPGIPAMIQLTQDQIGQYW